MLKIFRTNRFFNSLVLFLYVIVTRGLSFVNGAPNGIQSKGALTDWIIPGLEEQGILELLAGIFLVYLHALLLNRVVIRNRITNELTLFPGLFYVLITSYFPEYNGLSSPLIANTFVLIAIGGLFASHKNTGSAARIFDTGFWLSMAGLCYFGYSVLILYGIVGMSMLRTLKSREWLQYMIGYLTPFFILGMLGYLIYGNTDILTGHFSQQFATFNFRFNWDLTMYLEIGLFTLFILVALAKYPAFFLKKNIHTHKKINLLYWLMFMGFAVVLIQSGIFHDEWIIMTIPIACFLAMSFIGIKNRGTAEFLHFVLLAGSIALQVLKLL